MYTIYINNRPLYLVQDLDDIQRITPKTQILEYASDMQQMIADYIALLESEKSQDTVDAVILLSDNIEMLQRDVWQHFKHIEAAGGVVKNQDGEILAIYRRDFWDLPKGKIDAGETPEQAAVREVQEETGIEVRQLHDLIGKTYHTYRNRKDKLVLKTTWWYNMETNATTLVPQTEEDIEKAVWLSLEELCQKQPIYPNILHILSDI